MIYTPFSKFTRSTELPLAANVDVSVEGIALVAAFSGGVLGLSPSGGNSGEVFAGFSLLQTSAVPGVQSSTIKVEELTTTASGSDGVVTLARTPVGKVGAIKIADGSQYADANVAESGTTITITGIGGGVDVRVVYRHALTAAESRSLYGDPKPEGYSGNIQRQIGVAQEGVVYTNAFAADLNWGAGTAITTGASGYLTQGGNGATLNGYVVALPSVDYPYLGIQFSAA